MNLRPRKLSLAHRLLVDLLSGGPHLVASCVTWAREAVVSQRTLSRGQAPASHRMH